MGLRQIFPRVIVAAAGGAVNWLARTGQGVVVAPVVGGTLAKPVVVGGLAVAQAPTKAVSRSITGVAAATSVDGSTLATTGQGVVAQSLLSGIIGSPTSGLDVVSTTVGLVQTTFVLSASSTGTWQNPTNAQGANNGTNATNANTLTGAASGALTMTFVEQVGKTALDITAAELQLYWNSTVSLAGPGRTIIEYSINAGSTWTQVINTTVAQSFATTPQTVDIASAVGQSWPALTDLRVRYTFTSTSGLASTTRVDAVKLTVNATKTVTN
jgi:hypothetical protein